MPSAAPPVGLNVQGYRVDEVLAFEEPLDSWACRDNERGLFYIRRVNGKWELYAAENR